MSHSTSHRLFALNTPLGEDVLLIKDFHGHERLSRLFEFKLTLGSERDDIPADALVGKRVTLRIETVEGDRHWTGFVSRFTRLGPGMAEASHEEQLTFYHCEVVPWLWFMGLNEDSRIFQDKSIPDIVEEIFSDFLFNDYKLDLSGDHAQLPYCVQYRESNLNFISRLLERAGIYYYFRHEEETEILVLTDNKDDLPKLDPMQVRFTNESLLEEVDSISSLVRRQQIVTGRIVMRDYNFETPHADLEARVESMVRIGDNSNFERFFYPGGYGERAAGENQARLVIEAEEAEHEVLDGSSNVRLLTAGYVFSLDEHPDDALNRDYLVLSVQHHGSNNLGDSDSSSTYTNTFSVIPHEVLYREPAITPRTRVAGPQSAVVVGPAGEEIYTDKYGRIKVKFFWDRTAQVNEKCSCWLRVAQMWSGRQWGTFFLPRIGMEVIVDFMEGDPDRPFVSGCLYNADNMPPYPLPDNATRTTIKTNSSKGGGGFNELRFEDKKGSEQVFVHAQKDLEVRVGNVTSMSTVAEEHRTVGSDRMTAVAKQEHLSVGKIRFTGIGEDDHLDIGRDQVTEVGSDAHFTAGKNTFVESGTEIHVKAGATLVLEAGVTISIKAGPSSVVIGPSGVTIDGPLVKINSGGSPKPAKKPEKPDPAKKPKEAIKDKPGQVSDPVQRKQAATLRVAAQHAKPFCAECEADPPEKA